MNHTLYQGEATRIPLADRSVDLVFGSPPYCKARTYDDGTLPAGHRVSRGPDEWVSWMLRCTREALRVSRGAVVWVVASMHDGKRTYLPAVEGLVWEWFRLGGSAYRPVYWHRVGIPGSGGDQWFRADIEQCLCFKRHGPLPWSDNLANGHPPKYAPGGELSHRLTNGERRNQWGHSGTGNRAERRRNGTIGTQARPSHVIQTAGERAAAVDYAPPVKANPGNLVEINVGGGHMGSKLAHENEAPFPVKLAAWFISSLVPPGGTVLDPFAGSGTVAQAAEGLGRNSVLGDLRSSQVDLCARRVAEFGGVTERLACGKP